MLTTGTRQAAVPDSERRHVHFPLRPASDHAALRRTKILFVTATTRVERPYLDPSVRYRCYNAAQDLSKAGCVVDVIAYPKLRYEMVDWYDYFVFHRPVYGQKLLALLDHLQERNKHYSADYDDLIFDIRHALYSSAFRTGTLTEAKVLSVFEDNHRALRLFPKVTVSTTALREQVLLSHPEASVEVIHNGLSREWLPHLERARPVPRSRRTHVIGYFSGTKSHDHDFAQVEDVLAELLRAHAHLKLLVAGPLEFDRRKFFPQQLIRHNVVDYRDLPDLILKSTFTIAPLEDNLFNQCKSGLKFFEAGLFGRPTVATPIADMQRFDGSGILFAREPKEWTEALLSLIDLDFYDATSQRVRSYTQAHCYSQQQSSRLFGFLTEQNA